MKPEDIYKSFLKKSEATDINKFNNFSKYTRRQTISRFLAIYNIFLEQLNIKGSIIECGVNQGMCLFSLAHMSIIHEPYNYHRKIIGFDTFEGFPGVSEKDKKTSYSKVGAFKHNYNSYKDIINSVKFFNKNRFLNNKNKILTIKGDAVKTIPKFVQNNKHLVVSSLWLDFDLYEPTKVALDNFLPLIPKGGIVIFDQLNNSMWPGETRAFFEKKIKYSKLKNFNFEPNLCYLIIK